MRILGIISAIAGVLALIFVLYLLQGLLSDAFGGDGAGMAFLLIGLWAIVLTGAGLFFGLIAYMMAKGRDLPLPLPGKVGFWASGAAATIIVLALALD